MQSSKRAFKNASIQTSAQASMDANKQANMQVSKLETLSYILYWPESEHPTSTQSCLYYPYLADLI